MGRAGGGSERALGAGRWERSRVVAAAVVALTCLAGACRSGEPTAEVIDADARCVPGSAGCVCDDRSACQDGSACYYGVCFSAPDQMPKSYYYSQQNLDDEERVNALIREAVPIAAGSRVADIGAGAGFYTVHAARLVGDTGRVYATDIDQGRLDSIAAMLERLPDGAELKPRIELRLVDSPYATALESLPPASLDLVVMLRVLTFRPDERAADLPYLRRIAEKVRPGGRFVYHMDWVHEAGYREYLTALMRDAGFTGAVDEIPLPAHIPETVEAFDWSLVQRPKMTLRRGFILVFHR
ncbi:MAG: class I SAM-dependent methyltransferase [Deltaproteobacteria bacterium]|nr:class I SAM-dependent methyltransferase [Deltaproteobacteria bacterium]